MAIDGIGVYTWNNNGESAPVIMTDVEIRNNEVYGGTEKPPLIGLNVRSMYGADFDSIIISGNNLIGNIYNIATGAVTANDTGEFENVRFEANTLEGGETGVGMYNINRGSMTFRQNDIRNSSDWGVNVLGGGVGAVEMRQNNITGNGDGGAINETDKVLDMKRNWWGARNGPGREAGKSGQTVGDGDRVQGAIEYTPWLNKEI